MNKQPNPRRLFGAGLLPLIAALVIASTTLAASSANYQINWEQQGAGGGEGATSTSYRLSASVGQPVAGDGSSSNYRAHIGYRQAFGTLTPAPINTPGGPTNTPQRTNTPGPPTNTPVPTNTPGGPTNTPQPTNTPGPPTATPSCPIPFVDINGNVFYGAITYLYCHGAVNGTDATHYSPAGTSTRGQFAKVVVLGFGEAFYTPPGGGQDFTDVAPGYFAYTFIETGFHNGILSGFDPAGCTAHGATYPCYMPNIPITRGQLTKLVVGAAHYPLFTPTGGTQTFSDVPPSNVFFVSIETAHNKGVINGYPDHTFHPNNNIRRDEMAQIVYKGVTTP